MNGLRTTNQLTQRTSESSLADVVHYSQRTLENNHSAAQLNGELSLFSEEQQLTQWKVHFALSPRLSLFVSPITLFASGNHLSKSFKTVILPNVILIDYLVLDRNPIPTRRQYLFLQSTLNWRVLDHTSCFIPCPKSIIIARQCHYPLCYVLGKVVGNATYRGD